MFFQGTSAIRVITVKKDSEAATVTLVEAISKPDACITLKSIGVLCISCELRKRRQQPQIQPKIVSGSFNKSKFQIYKSLQDSVYSQNCEDLQSAHYHVDRRCQRTSKMEFNKISYCLVRVPGKIHNCIITAWVVRGWISFSTSVSGVSSGVDKRQEFLTGK